MENIQTRGSSCTTEFTAADSPKERENREEKERQTKGNIQTEGGGQEKRLEGSDDGKEIKVLYRQKETQRRGDRGGREGGTEREEGGEGERGGEWGKGRREKQKGRRGKGLGEGEDRGSKKSSR